MIKLKNNGETIVEVLISIAILALALGSAFAIANKARATVLANQERYQAQLLANTQADALKAYMATNTKPVITFCLIGGELQDHSDASKPCFRNNLYDISVTPKDDPCNCNPNLFLIRVEWDSLIYNGKDNVELVYGT